MDDIVAVPRTDIVHTEFLTQTEAVVREVLETKNFDTGFRFVKLMKEMKKTLDDGTGIVLNGMAEIWNPEEQDGEDFDDAVVRITGLDKVTVRNHLKVQRAMPLIPEDYREEVMQMPFRSKKVVAELVEGGYEMGDGDWLNVVQHPSPRDVEGISRKIKGVEPRSNYLLITIDDNGVLVAHTVRGHFEVGRLNTFDDNPDIQKAISRLTSCTGVQPAQEY